MPDGDSLPLLTTAVLFLVVVLASPTVGVVDVTGDPPAERLGGGNATVTDVELRRSDVRVTAGRFGTDVYYLRIPDATVTVSNVTGTPRLVYRVTFPSLSFDQVATKVLDERDRRVRLAFPDRAFETDTIAAGTHVGEIAIRVQSFDADTTVYRRTVTVEVTSK